MTNNHIIENLDNPDALEESYQNSPDEFQKNFKKAFSHNAESETLKVWQARLNYQVPITYIEQKISISWLLVLCFIAGFIAKIPELFRVNDGWYYPRFIPLAVIGVVIFYFLKIAANPKVTKRVAISLLAITAYATILPDNTNSASITMALIHLPLLLLTLLATSFMADDWKSVESRLSFIRYVGEMGIYSILILLGGMILTAITLGLFGLIELSIEKWYMGYVVVLGLVSSPLVATYLFDTIQNRQSKFAIILSNVFSPLFLVTIVVYLMATIYQGNSPFRDRDFLILFNGLLLVILAITIFSISGRSKESKNHATDYINMALVTATLLVNIVALSAIVFRWAEHGLTINRVVVTGANILIFIHLALILKQYVELMKSSGVNAEVANLERAIAKYLPVYSIWSVIVAVVLPLMFEYK